MAIRRGGLAEHVYSHIKELLLDGKFDHGESIPVERITEELSVSRQPVMDALKRLSIEGFLVILPQIGCRIREYEPNEITDFFLLFAEGEALIAELAAKRSDAADIAKLSAISFQIGELRGADLSVTQLNQNYRVLNRKLHFEMRQAARSAPIAEVVENLGDRSDFFVAASARPIFSDRLESAHEEHEAILDAIRKGDPDRARAVMKQHILHIEERINGPERAPDAAGKIKA
ncbi:hypothetical protein JT55_06315 [Rhodovulum sp. NI22]|jgi:DNA-binding GntR family transcriptional regulator|uniref:GntR family transcriptional regulator n=1 Tax=Actibacterium sp. TaxID=1872125 RepID=UPI00050FEEC5|nr:GntR family transcriptional regulator [Actibacterium sp.]KGB82699.1 hypothetical protein JT55_06315 [Rhodovulum sp. NI22]